MKSEKINQAPHDSGVHLWLVLRKANHAIGTIAAEQIQSMEMCYSDFAILEVLLHKGTLPVQEIGKKVLLTSGSITTAVQRLVKRGYVKVIVDNDDARIKRVTLSPSGNVVIQRCFRDHQQKMELASSHLNEREQKQLIKLLKKYGKGAKTHKKRTQNEK
jgi:MarR family 2-MHQ and catechol resistance regulon transcriptional repressor